MELGGHRGRLRSMEPEEFQILKLKKEAKALMDRRREEQALEDRMAAGEEAQPAVAAGKDRATAEEETQPSGKKRKKKVVKTVVPQGLIDYMITNPCIPWYGFREETLPNRSQEFRQYYAKRKAMSDKYLEYDLTLIKQYVIKGHAHDYTEITDDEAEDI